MMPVGLGASHRRTRVMNLTLPGCSFDPGARDMAAAEP